MTDLTVIILTKNEEMNIRTCIESVKDIAKRIVVLDSFSTDKTVEISKSIGAEIYTHEFINYGNQFQYAIDNCNINTKWVFRFDADERLTRESAIEIEELCKKHKDTDVNGFIFKLEVKFLGKSLKHGGTYPFKKLCIFKTGFGYMEDRYMDEQIVLTEGRSIEMKTVSKHEDFKDLSFWIQKHNWYATRAARDYFERQNSNEDDIIHLDLPAKVRRFIKYKIYYKMPMRMRCWMYFIYRYIFRLGFLDGREGFLYVFFQAYWYRLLVDAKIYEAQKFNKVIGGNK